MATKTRKTTEEPSAAALQDTSEKSDYERLRAQNIERNNARLRALGLISALEEERSNDAAWGRPFSVDESPDKKPSSNKKKRKVTTTPTSSRKSRRLQGIQPEVRSEIVSEKERHERVRECRQVRLQRANSVEASKAAKENPTATYEHCLMRVQTMSDKALANRVKAIERAAGKHCVVKMGIFKSCLQDEDKWDLAKLASDALERLKALKSPPE